MQREVGVKGEDQSNSIPLLAGGMGSERVIWGTDETFLPTPTISLKKIPNQNATYSCSPGMLSILLSYSRTLYPFL